jgi:hypothetical protein
VADPWLPPSAAVTAARCEHCGTTLRELGYSELIDTIVCVTCFLRHQRRVPLEPEPPAATPTVIRA